MLTAITGLLVFQLAGEVVVTTAGLPVPGPVCGMALLFTALVVRGGVPAHLGALADGLLANLSLLFVPAGVGLLLHLPVIARDGAGVSVGLVVSTAAAIVVTGVAMDRLNRPRRGVR